MKPTLTDYITTETVMNAFSGAKDLAQAGAEATVTYYWASALIWCIAPLTIPVALFFGLKAQNKVHQYNLKVKREQPYGPNSLDYIDSGVIRGALFGALLLSIVFSTLALCENFPVLISPEGALLYKIATGVAQ